MMIAIAIISTLFLALALIRLDWAVLAIIATLPAYLVRFNILGIPMTLLEAMILIAFAVWFFEAFLPDIKNIFKARSTRTSYPYSIEMILVLIVSIIAAGTAGWSDSALGIWKAYFFEPLLLFVLMFNVFRKKDDWLKALGALALSAAAVSLFAICQKITGAFISNPFWAAAGTRRVVSFFGYPNAVGLYLAPLTMIMSGWLASSDWRDGIFTHERGKKIFLSLAIAASIASIYFAKSEGALIGLAAGSFFFALLTGKKSRIAALAVLAICGLGIWSYAPAKSLLIEKATLSDLSGSIRKQQWKETLIMLNNGRLISGAGLSNYQEAVKPYHQEGLFYNSDNLPDFDAQLRTSAEMRAKYWQPVEIYMYPHNIVLNFWSELGLAGALLFIWIIGRHIFSTVRLGRKMAIDGNRDRFIIFGLSAAMIAIAIHGLVDVPYFKNDLAAMFWIIIALSAAFGVDYKAKKK